MLERLSWKRLVFELDLMLYSGLHFGGLSWIPAVVSAGVCDRAADLAFLELTAPLLVVVG